MKEPPFKFYKLEGFCTLILIELVNLSSLVELVFTAVVALLDTPSTERNLLLSEVQDV